MKRVSYLPFLCFLLLVTSPVAAQESATPVDETVDGESTKATHYGAQEIGSLSKGDGRLQAGEFRDLYVFQGKAGDPLVIELISEDFDPYLAVVSPSGKILRNDDWGGSSAARIQMRLIEDGGYKVVVTSFRPGEMGGYLLRIKDQRIRIAE